MNVKTNLRKPGEGLPLSVLLKVLKMTVPKLELNAALFEEITRFILKNPHAFFEKQKWPIELKNFFESIDKNDLDNLLTVLEGAKSIVKQHQLSSLENLETWLEAAKENTFFYTPDQPSNPLPNPSF